MQNNNFELSYELFKSHCNVSHSQLSNYSECMCCCLVVKSCSTLHDPMDQSTPGPPVFRMYVAYFKCLALGPQLYFTLGIRMLNELLPYYNLCKSEVNIQYIK